MFGRSLVFSKEKENNLRSDRTVRDGRTGKRRKNRLATGHGLFTSSKLNDWKFYGSNENSSEVEVQQRVQHSSANREVGGRGWRTALYAIRSGRNPLTGKNPIIRIRLYRS